MKKTKQRKDTAQKYDKRMRPDSSGLENVTWFSPYEKPFRLLGMGWKMEEGVYRRMPLEKEWNMPEAVYSLAWSTSGLQVRFRTDSRRICLYARLRGVHSMDHMPATGQCGFDAYIGEVGDMTFAGVARFARDKDEYKVTICNFPDSALRTVTLNFPLYQGLEKLEVGIDRGSRLVRASAPAIRRSVVVYGTSITQGGCATRPGMSYTNILSRRIDAEFINLGFSGSGRGEPEVAKTIVSLSTPALFVMDYEANSGGLEKMRETLPVFLEIIRKKWRRTPIMVVSKVPYAAEAYDAARLTTRLAMRNYQRATVASLKKAGDENIWFFDGGKLLGKDYTECSVDGVHQTDLGFLRMANALEKPFRKILGDT